MMNESRAEKTSIAERIRRHRFTYAERRRSPAGWRSTAIVAATVLLSMLLSVSDGVAEAPSPVDHSTLIGKVMVGYQSASQR